MYVRAYVHDSVRLRLRYLYHVEFCSFIVRYPTAGASVYCGHISSFILYLNFDISKYVFLPTAIVLFSGMCLMSLNPFVFLSVSCTQHMSMYCLKLK